jgi:hypothetical protein
MVHSHYRLLIIDEGMALCGPQVGPLGADSGCWGARGAGDLGTQGGDPARLVAIDLSTCVNRYGPPPAALHVLRHMKPVDLLIHPYDAAGRLREVYARTLGVDACELLTSRATSEVIWAMGRTLYPRAVAVPLPAYTDYLWAFPGRGFTPATMCGHSIGQLDAALAVAGVVLISNPHNPTGSVLGSDELTAVALRRTRRVFRCRQPCRNRSLPGTGRGTGVAVLRQHHQKGIRHLLCLQARNSTVRVRQYSRSGEAREDGARSVGLLPATLRQRWGALAVKR